VEPYHTRCLFEVFISIISKAQVQMCFAPADERAFFDALGSGAGAFDAKAVCSTIDAMKAMASVEEDKEMITERIKEEVGIDSYNEQVRQVMEQQYKFVALRLGGRQGNRSVVGANGHTSGSNSSSAQHGAGGDCSGGDGFAEVLKHLRRLDLRLGGMEKQLGAIEEKQEEVAEKQQKMEKKQEEATLAMEKKQEGVASKLEAMEKNQHGIMARERRTQ
jgi:hypothetical protein